MFQAAGTEPAPVRDADVTGSNFTRYTTILVPVPVFLGDDDTI